LKYQNNAKYIGEFRNGIRYGDKGKFYYSNGKEIKNWKSDRDLAENEFFIQPVKTMMYN